MTRRSIFVVVVAATAAPLIALAQWQGAPGSPPDSNATGPVWLQSGTPSAQTGSFSVSGDGSVGDDIIFTATGQAIEVNGSGSRTLNIGNWGAGATGFTLGIYGDVSVLGFGGANGSLTTTELCLGADCRTAWPAGGGGGGGDMNGLIAGSGIAITNPQGPTSTVALGTTYLNGSAHDARFVNVTGDTMTGRLNIGTQAAPIAGLALAATSTGIGIVGHATGLGPGILGSGSGIGSIGVAGNGYTGISGSGNTGVWGSGTAFGVHGISNAASGRGVYGSSDQGNSFGVYGYNPAHIGVYGYGNYGIYGQGFSNGVRGASTGTALYGVGSGANSRGLYATGEAYGAVGQSTNGYGVYGESTNGVAAVGGSVESGTAIGVDGWHGGNGTGVRGGSVTGIGVLGSGNNAGIGGSFYGMVGAEAYGAGISPSSIGFRSYGRQYAGTFENSNSGGAQVALGSLTTGVMATGTTNGGRFYTNNAGFSTGVEGRVSGTGAYGVSGVNVGGSGGYGLHGFASGANSYGVHAGSSANPGTGVYGYAISSNSIGVHGAASTGNGIGVQGSAAGASGIGVQATAAASGYGFGTSNDNNVFGAQLSTGVGLVAVGDPAGGAGTSAELRITNPSPTFQTHFNYANSGSNYIRGTFLNVDTAQGLRISTGLDAALGTGAAYILMGATNANNIVMDDNEIVARNNSAASPLYLNDSGGDIRVCTATTCQLSVNTTLATNAITLPNNATVSIGSGLARIWDVYSDGRFKFNQKELTAGLDVIMKLQPKSYDHYSGSVENGEVKIGETYSHELGFIAQEIYKVMPEAVTKPKDEANEMWSVDYDRIIPVLVKSVQELKVENDALKARIEKLERK